MPREQIKSPAIRAVPDPFSYTDYRVLLRDYVERRKVESPGWSYGVWARQLRLRSPSTLIMIVNGQRHPGPKLSSAICRNWKFTPIESEYFEDLVRLHKVKSDPGLTVVLLDRLQKKLHGKDPRRKFHFLDQETFAAISNWHFYAIREMVTLAHFREDVEWIARELRFHVTPKEVRRAIDTLLALGLLARKPGGRLVQASGAIDTSDDVASEGLKRFHEQMLAHSREALRAIPISERQIVGTTYAMPMRNLPKARDLMRKFLNEFCDLLEEPGSDTVFHLELALIPLTKNLGAKTCV